MVTFWKNQAMIDWKQYQQDWMAKLRKHNYNEEYALNLMNQVWISITELKVSVTEQVNNVIKFIDIWHQLMILVKNTAVSKRWTAQERAKLQEKVNAQKDN